MYKLLVRWMDGQQMSRTIKDVGQLRNIIASLKGGVIYSEVITPSGVSKEITKEFYK